MKVGGSSGLAERSATGPHDGRTPFHDGVVGEEVSAMFLRRRRPGRQQQQPDGAPPTDYGFAAGRHRLSDGDVVPVAGYRRYADILAAPATGKPPRVSRRRQPPYWA
jgi:hypothetical protein